MEEKVQKKPETKKKKVFSIVLSAVIGTAIAVFFALSCFQFYLCVYLKPFWVDGQSMYPYLNEHAKNADGSEMKFNVGPKEGSYDIDFGVMNCHKGAIKKIKRFDVIITRFDETPVTYIKRVIGLPGETVQFTNTGSGNEHNGDLYINGVYTTQPIAPEVIRAGVYGDDLYTLKDNEYFVCGDNRYPGASKDSRDDSIGFIKKEYIVGKAVALTGRCKVGYNSKTNTYEPEKTRYHWPRFLK